MLHARNKAHVNFDDYEGTLKKAHVNAIEAHSSITNHVNPDIDTLRRQKQRHVEASISLPLDFICEKKTKVYKVREENRRK